MVFLLMLNILASFSSRGRIPGGGGQGVGFPKSSPVEQAHEDFDGGRIPGGGGQGVGFPKSSPVEQAHEDFDEPSAC
jgi:hypothetical protein